MITRRSMLLGLGATGIVLAAPAVIRTPGLLMPIKPRVVEKSWIRFRRQYVGGNLIWTEVFPA